jgi:hypothetical protein
VYSHGIIHILHHPSVPRSSLATNIQLGRLVNTHHNCAFDCRDWLADPWCTGLHQIAPVLGIVNNVGRTFDGGRMDHTPTLVSDNMSFEMFLLSFSSAIGTTTQKADGGLVRANNHGWPDYYQSGTCDCLSG